jgi:dipeptidyl aminopeptidase/acylaminoacyl peptidase
MKASLAMALAAGFVLNTGASAAMPHLDSSKLKIEQPKKSERHDVTVADLMSLRELNGLYVSPDGRSAATLLNAPDVAADSYQIAWFIVSTSQSGAAINVGDAGDPQLFDNSVSLDGTPARHFNLPAKWSPDSRFIAYLRAMDGEVQVWRSARDGGAPMQLTHSRADVSDFAWTDDGRGLLFATDASREALGAAERQEARDGFLVGPATRWSYEHNRPFRRPYALTDDEPKIWRLDLETGVERPADDAERQAYSRLTAAARSQSEDIPAPKGGWIAQLRPLDPDQQYNRPPRRLSLLRPGSSPLSCGALCQGDFPPGLDGRASIWWGADGSALYFRRQNGLNEAGFTILEWLPGRTKPRTVMSSRDTVSSCTLLEGRLLCLQQTPSTPRMVVSYDLRTGAVTTLFDPNPQWSAVRLGETSWLDWTDDEGHRTYGLLVKPLNYVKGRRYPLVLIGYNPADALRGDIAGRYPAHVLAAQGVAAIVYNLWGPEAGFHGPDYVAQNYRNASQGVAFRQLEAVIDRLANDGLVDPQRVGVGGFSNGLNPAAYGLIHSDRFRTASFGWLRWNPTSYYANRDPFSVLLEDDDLVTPMDEPPSALIRNLSLAFNAARVRAPILVNASDSEFLRLSQMEPLRRFADAGKPLEMHVFPDETHAFFHPAHRDVENRRNLQWFQFWLQDVEAPDPVDPEQYARWRSYRPVPVISTLEAGSQEMAAAPDLSGR